MDIDLMDPITTPTKKDTTYPNKTMSDIGKILIGCCTFKRVWSTQIKKNSDVDTC